MIYRYKWTTFLRMNRTTIPDLVYEYIQQAEEAVVWRNHPWRRKWGVEELKPIYEGWNFNSGNYLFTTDTK